MPFDIHILTLKDILDILLVAFLLYKTYKLMKSSGSINIFTGILVFIVIWVIVSQVLQMRLLGSIFDKLVSVGVIALIVLFQEEIRRFLLTLGSRHHSSSWFRFLRGNKKTETSKEDIMPIDTLIAFAESDAGAKVFGEEHAKEVAAHAKEIKEAGAVYCDCPACSAAAAILAKKDELLL